MKKVLEQINTLFDEMTAEKARQENEAKRLEEQRVKQDKKEIEQKAKDSELVAREAETKKVEDIVALNHENKVLLTKIQDEREELRKEKGAFNVHMEEKKKELDKGLQEIKALKEKYEKDRATMKDEVIAEVLKSLKK